MDTIKAPDILSKVKVSEDAFSTGVNYGADFKTFFDRKKNLVYLYGNAFVEYEEYSIREADYIEVDLDKNIATARLLPDSMKHLIGNTVYDTVVVVDTVNREEEVEEENLFEEEGIIGQTQIDPVTGEPIENNRERNAEPVNPDGTLPGKEPGTPLFSDGTNEFSARAMRYNFNTKKGKVYNAVTFQNNLYIHGTQTKFIEKLKPQDTLQTIYNQGALFTTCNAPVPHFGIRSNKQKIVPNKELIIGPSNLEIMGIPTPLVLPFGFYPIVPEAKAGLVVPSYEYSQNWGFGLRGLGYYTPVSDNMNLTVKGDIYFNGSWMVNGQSRYTKRYKFNGGFSMSFSNRLQAIDGEIGKRSNKSFSLRWNHSQDRSAHPFQNFGASVSFTTGGFDKINYNQADRVLNNNTSSNISYRHELPGTPFSLSANVSHSQNSNTRSVSLNMPSLDIRMRSLQPFKRKNSTGLDEKWYEKILLTYSSQFDYKVQTTDTTVFQPDKWKSNRYGVQHQGALSSSYQLFRYINVTPSINFNERWYFDRVQKRFDATPRIEYDTITTVDGLQSIVADTLSYGEVITDTIQDFNAVHGFSASLSMQTSLYLTKLWKGKIRGFRHVMKPSVSVSFTPDYQKLGYVDTLRTINQRAEYEVERYSYYENGIYGAPSTSQGNLSLSYSVRNIMEAKFFNKKDSTENKISLFKTFDFSGNFNPYADSLHFSPINFNANTSLFNNLTYFRVRAMFSPYAANERGNPIDQYYYETGNGILRFGGLNASLSTNLTIGRIRELLSGSNNQEDNSSRKKEQNANLFDNFRVSHEIRFVWDPTRDIDIFRLSTNNIRLSGNIDLTKNWGIRVGNFGYDFERKQLTYPDFGFSRDLHCWEISFSWQPTRKTFLFNIRVKNAPLDFIDIPYNRGIQDSGYSPF
ncbi:putative LPS assembly protein LptD [Membranihabitans maritimus]|uniref:putative LPS assembly protein LptD n=1 Tax=Membranihabitans maritimus TaxID=2904244 RepID=UPI001F3856BE|nr:putative LPS assembly protein LptD [Membranihabitans maritimus]